MVLSAENCIEFVRLMAPPPRGQFFPSAAGRLGRFSRPTAPRDPEPGRAFQAGAMEDFAMHSSEQLAPERTRTSDPRSRPATVVIPGPGQESVWNYPRPPRVEPVYKRIRVQFGGVTIADTTQALRVVETSCPPVYYVPPEDVRVGFLTLARRITLCEWKGTAHYWNVKVGDRIAAASAWGYPDPVIGYEAIRDYLAFYPQRMDACWVGAQRVKPQPGWYYGGWVTSDIVGPFKGAPGTEAW
jgi:uncharacterized protein (DUF427 family)